MRSIQARRDDPEHFFATRGEISAEDLNTASDGIVTYLFLKTLCHIVHFLTNSPVAINIWTNPCQTETLHWLLSVIAGDTNTSPSERDRNQWQKTKVNDLFYYSMSVCVGGIGKADFIAHPITAPEKEAEFCPNEDKSQRRKNKEQKPKSMQKCDAVNNALLRSDFILCFIKVSVLLFDKNINRLMFG